MIQAKKSTAERPHYTLLVEWSEEDKAFIGRCPELFMGGVHGDDRVKVYEELCQAVDEWVDMIQSDGKELPKSISPRQYSGKFNLRIEPALHKLLAIRAMAAGDSLNTYCAKKLANAI